MFFFCFQYILFLCSNNKAIRTRIKRVNNLKTIPTVAFINLDFAIDVDSSCYIQWSGSWQWWPPCSVSTRGFSKVGPQPKHWFACIIGDIGTSQIYWYWHVSSTICADIKTVFWNRKKKLGLVIKKMCNHIVCPAEVDPLFNY